MTQHLLLTVRLHDHCYHGRPEWPPSPARVFQALVAGVACGRSLPPWAIPALEWLQALPAPIIAAPRMRLGSRIQVYVPNNDADSVGAEPNRMAEIRTSKTVEPRLLADDTPFRYAWPLDAESTHAEGVREAAAQLYRLGWGIDSAWAKAEIIDEVSLERLLSAHDGTVHRPGGSSTGNMLLCPAPGSLESLVRRHDATLSRIHHAVSDDSERLLFAQPPKARFASVAYDNDPFRTVYELLATPTTSRFAPWPLAHVAQLVVHVRDAAVFRLKSAMPDRAAAVDLTLVGRTPDGDRRVRTDERVRIVPLPSIGHPHADHAIRRVLIEVATSCSLDANDIAWAFSGIEPIDAETGEVLPLVLVPTQSDAMLSQYGIGEAQASQTWYTVIAAALPEYVARRRIEPSRQIAEAKGASERSAEQERAAGEVLNALRHAQVRETVESICVQREPFEPNGLRAEVFANGTRFRKERLWHVKVRFAKPLKGPIVIGDGRFLGLGVMAPSA